MTMAFSFLKCQLDIIMILNISMSYCLNVELGLFFFSPDGISLMVMNSFGRTGSL